MLSPAPPAALPTSFDGVRPSVGTAAGALCPLVLHTALAGHTTVSPCQLTLGKCRKAACLIAFLVLPWFDRLLDLTHCDFLLLLYACTLGCHQLHKRQLSVFHQYLLDEKPQKRWVVTFAFVPGWVPRVGGGGDRGRQGPCVVSHWQQRHQGR